LEITWPGGRSESVADIKPNQTVTVQEGKGIIASEPIQFARALAPPGPQPSTVLKRQ
jgi:hypothetical protein